MKKKVILCGIFICLSGCISPEQAAEMQRQHEIAECINLGFRPNTTEFANCRLKIRSIDAERDMVESQRDIANQLESNSDSNLKCKVTHAGNTICK